MDLKKEIRSRKIESVKNLRKIKNVRNRRKTLKVKTKFQ